VQQTTADVALSLTASIQKGASTATAETVTMETDSFASVHLSLMLSVIRPNDKKLKNRLLCMANIVLHFGYVFLFGLPRHQALFLCQLRVNRMLARLPNCTRPVPIRNALSAGPYSTSEYCCVSLENAVFTDLNFADDEMLEMLER